MPALIGLVMFAIAVFVLHRSLAPLTLADITTEYHAVSGGYLVAAILLTIASYLLLMQMFLPLLL